MKTKDLAKIEFWIATGLYSFAIILLMSNSGNSTPNYIEYLMKGANLRYSYISNYLIPELFRFSILYFSFLLLNFCIGPSVFKASAKVLSILVIVILFLGIGLVTSILYTYSQAYLFADFASPDEAYGHFFFK